MEFSDKFKKEEKFIICLIANHEQNEVNDITF